MVAVARLPIRKWGLYLIIILIPGLVVVGCSSARDASYDRLDEWATRLNIGSVGKEVVRDYHGSTNFSDDAPTLQILLTGPTEEIAAAATKELTNNGFFRYDSGLWDSQGGGESRRVRISQLSAGSEWHFAGSGETVEISKPAVLINLSVFPNTGSS